jgi:hypothetical protein
VNKPRGRPFEPGNKMGRGRPQGSRNKPRPEGPGDLLKQYSEPLARKLIAQAASDPITLRMLLKYVFSPAPEPAVRIRLKRIGGMEDIEPAVKELIRDMSRGRISCAQGQKVLTFLETSTRILESVGVEQRLSRLEECLGQEFPQPVITGLPKVSPEREEPFGTGDVPDGIAGENFN